jgi:hypothetical protein
MEFFSNGNGFLEHWNRIAYSVSLHFDELTMQKGSEGRLASFFAVIAMMVNDFIPNVNTTRSLFEFDHLHGTPSRHKGLQAVDKVGAVNFLPTVVNNQISVEGTLHDGIDFVPRFLAIKLAKVLHQ